MFRSCSPLRIERSGFMIKLPDHSLCFSLQLLLYSMLLTHWIRAVCIRVAVRVKSTEELNSLIDSIFQSDLRT